MKVPTNQPSNIPSKAPSTPPTTANPTKFPTDQPTPSPIKLTTRPTVPDIPLEFAGDNGSPSSAFPLGECQGDCDDDDDCQV